MPEINENLSFPDPATPSRPLYPAQKTTPARGHSDQPNGAQIQRRKNAREISGIHDRVQIPVIASGGAGEAAHTHALLARGCADAIA